MSRIRKQQVRNRGGLVLSLSLLVLVALLFVGPLYRTLGLYLHGVRSGGGIDLAIPPATRLAQDAIQEIGRARRSVLASGRPGLPLVRLYVSEQAQQALLSDPPRSISRWQRAAFMYPDGSLRKVKVKHRGDSNPANYSLAKKSWTIRTRRSALFEGRRTVSYVVPQDENMIEEAVVSWMAREMNLLSPEVRLVELIVNDESAGIYYEIEAIDEIFLRSNGVMPVNVYKGDRDLNMPNGFSRQFFQTATIWSKVAESNRHPTADRADLERLLTLVGTAASSKKDWASLRLLAPYADWARFSAYQVLTQSWHNDALHNLRLLLDDQRGTASPIPWDVGGTWELEGFQMNPSSLPLLALYRRDSEFLLEELKYLQQYGVDEKLLAGAGRVIENLHEPFARSMERDVGRLQTMPLARALSLLFQPSDSMRTHLAMKESLRAREQWLADILSSSPEASWMPSEHGLSFVISGVAPLNNLSLQLDPAFPSPAKLALDTNSNGLLDPADLELPFSRTIDRLSISATWLANRVLEPKTSPLSLVHRQTGWINEIQPTRFALVGDPAPRIKSASGANALTRESFELANEPRDGLRPTRFNKPVLSRGEPETVVWHGEKRVSGNVVMVDNVIIEAGTSVLLDAGANLVFRGRLTVLGTAADPVMIQGATEEPWGAFAVHGAGARGSRLHHLNIQGGSGGAVDGTDYLAMFSIHDSRDVAVDHLTMRKNHLRDDMLHIVYGKNILLEDLNLQGAVADAIDIDMSEVVVRNSSISDSGNDCIDLMASSVLIEGVVMTNCGDKGTSIGEASTAALVDSLIRDSAIGAEVKDGSVYQIFNTDFVNNQVQLNAYHKNWRYLDNGSVAVSRAYFASVARPNKLNAEGKQRVDIFDSGFSGGIEAEGDIRISAESATDRDRRAASSEHWVKPLPLLRGIDVYGPRRRGVTAQ